MKKQKVKNIFIQFIVATFGIGILAIPITSLAETPETGVWYYIKARHSGQCLNVLNFGQRNGDNVVQGKACDTPNFQWMLKPAGDGFYFIKARHSNQCLNVLNFGQRNGDNVVQGKACDTTNFQWMFRRVQE